MDFSKFKTPSELQKETGLTVRQALRLINAEIQELKKY